MTILIAFGCNTFIFDNTLTYRSANSANLKPGHLFWYPLPYNLFTKLLEEAFSKVKFVIKKCLAECRLIYEMCLKESHSKATNVGSLSLLATLHSGLPPLFTALLVTIVF